MSGVVAPSHVAPAYQVIGMFGPRHLHDESWEREDQELITFLQSSGAPIIWWARPGVAAQLTPRLNIHNTLFVPRDPSEIAAISSNERHYPALGISHYWSLSPVKDRVYLVVVDSWITCANFVCICSEKSSLKKEQNRDREPLYSGVASCGSSSPAPSSSNYCGSEDHCGASINQKCLADDLFATEV